MLPGQFDIVARWKFLHQLYVGAVSFANDYNDYFPICTVGGANAGAVKNHVDGVHYSQYIGTGSSAAGDANLPFPPTILSPTIQPGKCEVDCLGYAYATKGLGDGKALWCPSFPVGSGRGIDAFSNPSYPSRNANGEVVGTMLFNPRTSDAWHPVSDNSHLLRAYPKTSSQWKS